MSKVQIAKQAVRSYSNAPQGIYEYTDRSANLMIIPNIWSLGAHLNIFKHDTTSQDTVSIEEITQGFGIVQDVMRGSRHQVSIDAGRRMHAFALPHFTLDDAITPQDVQSKRAYGADVLETVAAVRARKLETIRRTWAATHEKALWHTITTGTSYAPASTVQYDWYTQFGATRKVVPFSLANATTDIMAKIEEVYAHIQDTSEDGSIHGVAYAVASPEFFSALIAHPTMKAFYLYQQSQNPNLLVDRLAARGLDERFREFYIGGVHFIEYRGKGPDGVRYIAAGEAYAMPSDAGEDFQLIFGPAAHFDYVNTEGQEMYAFEYGDGRGQRIDIQTESNFIHVMRRPQMVVKLVMGDA